MQDSSTDWLWSSSGEEATEREAFWLASILSTRSFHRYAPRMLKIQTKDRGLQPFLLKPMQLDIEARRTKKRIIQLKGRQVGSTTYHLLRQYFRTATTPDYRAVIVAHELALPQELLEVIRIAWEHTPEWARPVVDKKSGYHLTFPRTRSSIRIGTAKAQKEGSGIKLGRTINDLLMTEVADPIWTVDVIMMLLQTVSVHTGLVTAESTAKGARGWFYENFTRAWENPDHPDERWQAFFYEWFWEPDYRMRVGSGFESSITPVEAELLHREHLDLEQIKWRREMIHDMGMRTFKELYPENARECFLLSGSTFFPGDALDRLLADPQYCAGWTGRRGDLRGVHKMADNDLV